MRLREQHDGHSVYVLYSDLLFNLVIIFLITVLALVLRLNHTIRHVAVTGAPPADLLPHADEAAEIRQLQYKLAKTQEDAGRYHADANGLRQQVVEARALLAKAQEAEKSAVGKQLQSIGQELSIAAGANRFTGRSGSTTLCLGIDFSGPQPTYVLINASTFASAHATEDNETTADHELRSAKLLVEACRNATRFTAADLTPIFGALQTKVEKSSRDEEGHLSFNFSNRASAAASGWLDENGEIDTARATQDLSRLPNFESIDQSQSDYIDNLIHLRDGNHMSDPPATVPVLHFSLADDQEHVQVGTTQMAIGRFGEVVAAFGEGGIILQYDGPDGALCPEWVIEDVLTPAGYTNSVPDPEKLKSLRAALQHAGQP